MLLGFCSLTFFVGYFATSTKTEFRATNFEFFSKRSKAAWENRRNHTELHSMNESVLIKTFSKVSEVLSALGGYDWAHYLKFKNEMNFRFPIPKNAVEIGAKPFSE